MLFPVLLNQENLSMIHHDSKLLYDIYNTINEHNWKQNALLIDLKISSITSSASSLIMISMISLFECITRSSSLSIEAIKLFAIVN